ncbi:hypothetical protein BK816_07985 [Boudabousia tangfeifanii]|uniref:Uncharacterized protein n=1 Tax=Boudabousia tangfeifanii TaxID=1912795 RepID=A0A1D9MLQ9_9ACTO|nr:hypothetical protein [Boudabousia tangfeifanii]AOZ73232.1 hypothetical protein BK816_07985 [Boudabousia tangfeifanii]
MKDDFVDSPLFWILTSVVTVVVVVGGILGYAWYDLSRPKVDERRSDPAYSEFFNEQAQSLTEEQALKTAQEVFALAKAGEWQKVQEKNQLLPNLYDLLVKDPEAKTVLKNVVCKEPLEIVQSHYADKIEGKSYLQRNQILFDLSRFKRLPMAEAECQVENKQTGNTDLFVITLLRHQSGWLPIGFTGLIELDMKYYANLRGNYQMKVKTGNQTFDLKVPKKADTGKYSYGEKVYLAAPKTYSFSGRYNAFTTPFGPIEAKYPDEELKLSTQVDLTDIKPSEQFYQQLDEVVAQHYAPCEDITPIPMFCTRSLTSEQRANSSLKVIWKKPNLDKRLPQRMGIDLDNFRDFMEGDRLNLPIKLAITSDGKTREIEEWLTVKLDPSEKTEPMLKIVEK